MKTFDSDNESNSYTPKEITDLLIDDIRSPSALHCNPELIKSYNVLKSTPMGHKGYFYQRVLPKNNITQDLRSQSLPNCVDDKNNYCEDAANYCDTQSKLLPQHDSPPLSPCTDLWFKTWPERCDKVKNDPNSNDTSINNSNKLTNTHVASMTCDISLGNGTKNTLTLEQALQNISLAYSPVTKQLHLVEEVAETKEEEEDKSEKKVEGKNLGHRRTEAGSFSSTVSSLSEPSTSGSLLDADERSLYNYEDTGAKPKKKSLSNFFSRYVRLYLLRLIIYNLDKKKLLHILYSSSHFFLLKIKSYTLHSTNYFKRKSVS